MQLSIAIHRKRTTLATQTGCCIKALDQSARILVKQTDVTGTQRNVLAEIHRQVGDLRLSGGVIGRSQAGHSRRYHVTQHELAVGPAFGLAEDNVAGTGVVVLVVRLTGRTGPFAVAWCANRKVNVTVVVEITNRGDVGTDMTGVVTIRREGDPLECIHRTGGDIATIHAAKHQVDLAVGVAIAVAQGIVEITVVIDVTHRRNRRVVRRTEARGIHPEAVRRTADEG